MSLDNQEQITISALKKQIREMEGGIIIQEALLNIKKRKFANECKIAQNTMAAAIHIISSHNYKNN